MREDLCKFTCPTCGGCQDRVGVRFLGAEVNYLVTVDRACVDTTWEEDGAIEVMQDVEYYCKDCGHTLPVEPPEKATLKDGRVVCYNLSNNLLTWLSQNKVSEERDNNEENQNRCLLL